MMPFEKVKGRSDKAFNYSPGSGGWGNSVTFSQGIMGVKSSGLDVMVGVVMEREGHSRPPKHVSGSENLVDSGAIN